ncbi:MAG: hypothetical protein IKU07_00455 [Oscillospiraceae bacterium]|nr:hypothetical protein [Oscillospiraceae bacterium]
MKKIISLVLCFALALGLCACGGGETAQETPKGLQVGFGREIVMPENPQNVHLNGTDTAGRKANGFLDYIKATCIALRDEQGNTVLMYTLDVLGVISPFIDELRPQVAQKTGVPEGNIIFSATHTHSSPAMTGTYPGATEYKKVFFAGAEKAAVDALADLSYAEISYGSTFTEKQVFVRHYVHDDGKITASSGITDITKIVGHPTEADEEMQIIRFTRPEEGKKDVLLISWNSHPTFHGGATDDQISADFPGPTRDYIESQGDYLVGYFTGDAGNQAPDSSIREEAHNMDYRQFGEKLGQVCLAALPNLKPATGNAIQLQNQNYQARANKERLDMLAQANEVRAVYDAQGRDAANALASRYGLYQFLEANAIIKRAGSADIHEVEMTALTVGDNISFVFASYEMFTNHGHALRTETPYDITFVASCSQGSNSYIPSQEAFDYGCYESYVAVVAPGTGEELVTEYLNMLKTMKGE